MSFDNRKPEPLDFSHSQLFENNTIDHEIKQALDIPAFAKRLIKGNGGFEVWESREVVAHQDRDVAIAEFVIRCLANPLCDGSEDVLNAIIAQRKLKTKSAQKQEDTPPCEISEEFKKSRNL